MHDGMDPRDAALALVNPGHVGTSSQSGQVAGGYEGDNAPDLLVGGTTLAGNIAGGFYAYHAKGGFWWTVLGVLVGGMVGNLAGRVVTLPARSTR